MQQPSEKSGLNYVLDSPYSHFNMMQESEAMFQLSQLSNPYQHFHIPPQLQEFKSSYFSSNSTSDEADEQNQSIINERKQRRMISNRESARRSRMRKQKHLDELWSQVVWLRNENHQLMDKLNNVSENHDKVLQENTKLKEENCELRQMLTDMKLNSPFSMDDITCNTAFLRAESSNYSTSTSVDLLG
ncbi:hypothetical protein ACFE04_009733 [Oxalis oulophora]